MFNIHAPGTKVATNVGEIVIVKDISSGGEGQGYLAEFKGKKVFYKQFHQTAVPPRTPEQTKALRLARTKWLVDAGLYRLDPLDRINAPFAHSTEGGYVCNWIDNLLPLIAEPEDGPSFLGQPRPYGQRVGVLLQITDLLSLVHGRGVSHGDLNKDNIGVVVDGNQVRVYLIDWSNFNCGDPKLPPMMAGTDGSMAWWVRTGGDVPDQASDMQSVGIYGHELLLNRPVIAGCKTPDEMLQRLQKGDLAGDPLRGQGLAGNDIGLPFEILAPELQAQFRIMLRPTKTTIPYVDTFNKALQDSLPNLISCPACKTPFWWHAARHSCPKCSQPIGAALNLNFSGKSIPIVGVTILGRNELGGDEAISTQHFRIHPVSPGHGQLVVLGRNGIKRQRGTERVFARQGQIMDTAAGDTLELRTSSHPLLISVS